MPAPVIKRFNENLSLATIDQIALVYFPAKSPSAEEVAAMHAYLRAAALRTPNGFGTVLLIPQDAGPPEGKVREQASEMFRSLKGRHTLMAGVLEGQGFAAAAKRSVFTVLVTVAFGGTSVKVFSSVAPASEWMVQEAKDFEIKAPPAAEIQACLEQMRRPTAA